MSKTILMFPYANLAPLRKMGPPEDYDFIYLHPRKIGQALINGISEAAPAPIGSVPDIIDKVEYLGAYGVSASEKVGSVLLFSQKPFEELGSGDTVYLTSQSATSVYLLYILLRERKNTGMPSVTRDQANATCVLLIGDDAIIYKGPSVYPYCFDLVTLWHNAFRKPFVFARWVVRKDLPESEKVILRKWLANLDTRDGELVENSAGLEAHRLGMTKDSMTAYLYGMRRVLSSEDLEGQALFMDKMTQYNKDYKLWRENASGPVTTTIGKRRLSADDCVRLLRDAPLGELMHEAHEERMKRHPGSLVTYVMDTNPNYTNICTVECSFCAFHRKTGDKSGYTLSADDLAERVFQAEKKGASTVLLQGGLNPDIKLAKVLEYIRAIKAKCAKVHLHPFSPAEINYFAELEGKSLEYVLRALWDEGVHTIPGGGAEVLSDRVRSAISPNKITSGRWVEVMEEAHRIGFQTTATMMYGHIETLEEIAEHLLRIRDSQDKTGGYQSFIAWSFKPGKTKLSEMARNTVHPSFYVRLIAVARLFLDNFDHIQSSWFSESENAGCLGLLAGADDFGGILVEENVHKSAGHERATTVARVQDLIKRSGFIPARRDSYYRVLEVYDNE